MCPGLESIDFRWRCWLWLSLLLFSWCWKGLDIPPLISLDTWQTNHSLFLYIFLFLIKVSHSIYFVSGFLFFVSLSSTAGQFVVPLRCHLSKSVLHAKCVFMYLYIYLFLERAGHIASMYRSCIWPGRGVSCPSDTEKHPGVDVKVKVHVTYSHNSFCVH